jgi:hypothetical protein
MTIQRLIEYASQAPSPTPTEIPTKPLTRPIQLKVRNLGRSALAALLVASLRSNSGWGSSS